jgi:(1->4)-alpha-D-glucan 1-alpha-D-glucosylmutase
VDPDNRRRVDFAARAAELDAVQAALAEGAERALAQWLGHWQDGRIKLAVLNTLLGLRRGEPELFQRGSYEPCSVTGPRADELIVYLRRHERRAVLTAVQRFPVRAARARVWDGTRIHVEGAAGAFVDVFTGRGAEGGELDPKRLFATLPVAVLTTRAADGSTRR